MHWKNFYGNTKKMINKRAGLGVSFSLHVSKMGIVEGESSLFIVES